MSTNGPGELVLKALQDAERRKKLAGSGSQVDVADTQVQESPPPSTRPGFQEMTFVSFEVSTFKVHIVPCRPKLEKGLTPAIYIYIYMFRDSPIRPDQQQKMPIKHPPSVQD